MVTNMTHRVSRRTDLASQNASSLVPFANTRGAVQATGNRLLSQEQQQRSHPNEYIWKKLELLIEKMQCEDKGIPVGTVKSLMSTVPSVFMGKYWLLIYRSMKEYVLRQCFPNTFCRDPKFDV